ncbi:N-ethylmaleimide reductase [Rhizobium aethiopicum]|uniref:N-ethylmaleimide reductase n=1 Tax=Rhizobium aethiopicum TaxID=1138170 RepID=A0A7W6MDX3_9HYPH|nr:alkene reductase [Rhizobium aethiopicum]MBB4190941.1 N-ethylmaleimide reductase [Rhizobium aethiopicum]MBB4578130.1 N-ethylmaleimide reductase [Rhizobium aethiopicum]
MAKLFEPAKVGDIAVKNRIVMAPLTRNRSPGAIPNDLNVEYYRQRATAGLIITEATAITHQGQGYADVPGLYSTEALDGWKRVTDAVHAAGGRIVVQMWHVGRISHTTLQPDGGKPVSSTNRVAKAKTYLVNADGSGSFADTSEPRALETAEIPGIIEDYRKAARAAIYAGFDGVEIHGANGYLLDQFIRDGVNDRTDQYGGSIENRTRLTFEVVDAVVREIGAGRTAIRISPVTPSGESYDSNPQATFTRVVEGLARYGLAYIHVIEGQTGGERDYKQGDNPSFDYKALRQAYEKAGGKASWMVNNGYDRDLAIDAAESGRADLVAFGKPFIANPDLVERLAKNLPLNTPDQSTFYGGTAKGYLDYPTLEKVA